MIVVAVTISIESAAFVQTQTGSTGSTITNDSQSQIEQLNKTMAELESSNNPQESLPSHTYGDIRWFQRSDLWIIPQVRMSPLHQGEVL